MIDKTELVCKCGKGLSFMNNYDYDNKGIKTIYSCINGCDVSVGIVTTVDGVNKFMVVSGDTTYLMTALEMVEEVNRGRSNKWTPYNEEDLLTGWWAFVEDEMIYLNSMGYEIV